MFRPQIGRPEIDSDDQPLQEFIPRAEARRIGIDPKTGEHMPHLRRENAPGNPLAQALDYVFAGIGGKPAFNTWAIHNQTEFYKMYAKFHQNAPEQQGDGQLVIMHVIPPSPLDD